MNNQIIKELREIAMRSNVVIITATQLKRPYDRIPSEEELDRGPILIDYIDSIQTRIG